MLCKVRKLQGSRNINTSQRQQTATAKQHHGKQRNRNKTVQPFCAWKNK
jgi:hypothetical protein